MNIKGSHLCLIKNVCGIVWLLITFRTPMQIGLSMLSGLGMNNVVMLYIQGHAIDSQLTSLIGVWTHSFELLILCK